MRGRGLVGFAALILGTAASSVVFESNGKLYFSDAIKAVGYTDLPPGTLHDGAFYVSGSHEVRLGNSGVALAGTGANGWRLYNTTTGTSVLACSSGGACLVGVSGALQPGTAPGLYIGATADDARILGDVWSATGRVRLATGDLWHVVLLGRPDVRGVLLLPTDNDDLSRAVAWMDTGALVVGNVPHSVLLEQLGAGSSGLVLAARSFVSHVSLSPLVATQPLQPAPPPAGFVVSSYPAPASCGIVDRGRAVVYGPYDYGVCVPTFPPLSAEGPFLLWPASYVPDTQTPGAFTVVVSVHGDADCFTVPLAAHVYTLGACVANTFVVSFVH
jgi:hypothetical protein